MKTSTPSLILASASPGRAQLLRGAGYHFKQIPSGVHEPLRRKGEPLIPYLKNLARMKAEAVSARHPDAFILAADTILEYRGIILGKPAHADDALKMLLHLSGKTHRVITAIYLIAPTVSIRRRHNSGQHSPGVGRPPACNAVHSTAGRCAVGVFFSPRTQPQPTSLSCRPTLRGRRAGGTAPACISACDEARVVMRSWTEDRLRQYIKTVRPFFCAGAYALQGAGAALIDRVEGDVCTVIGLPLKKVDEGLSQLGYFNPAANR